MTIENIKHIIAKGEGIDIEFKESQNSLTRSVFSSICAFLNRRGGHVFLGVSDNGEIVGINPNTLKLQLDTLAKDMNNPQVIAPAFYLNFETYEIEGKSIIYFYVPESPQPHTYKGTYYDRNQDGDFELKNTNQITDLCLRKQTDGIQRISLRDAIFRELCLNLLIHREYGNHRSATLAIYKDRVESDNWNIPFIDLASQNYL